MRGLEKVARKRDTHIDMKTKDRWTSQPIEQIGRVVKNQILKDR